VKPVDAAGEYWATLDDIEAHKPIARRHDAACKVLKEHMTERGLETFRGIRLAETPGGRRLDQKSALRKFGDKLNDCFIDTVRRQLIPVKRPALPKAS
jgi:hypothetical protein